MAHRAAPQISPSLRLGPICGRLRCTADLPFNPTPLRPGSPLAVARGSLGIAEMAFGRAASLAQARASQPCAPPHASRSRHSHRRIAAGRGGRRGWHLASAFRRHRRAWREYRVARFSGGARLRLVAQFSSGLPGNLPELFRRRAAAGRRSGARSRAGAGRGVHHAERLATRRRCTVFLPSKSCPRFCARSARAGSSC